MNKKFYILGAGGFAKEVLFLIKDAARHLGVFGGFIDYKPEKKWIEVAGRKEQVIEEDIFLQEVEPSNETSMFMGVGDPQLIAKLSERFKNYEFPNIIHHNFVGDLKSLKIGRGNIITSGCIFTVDIEIGNFNIFNLKTSVGHDTKIGDCNVFNPACNISGMVKIGSRNLFGVNSTILQNLEVKNDNIIGGASLANKPVASESIVVGVPGKKLKK